MGKVAVAVGAVAMLVAEPGEDAFPKLFHFCRQSRPSTADLGGVTDFLVAQAAQGMGPGAPRKYSADHYTPSPADLTFLSE
uniref:Uncharacterized protein n=1 Tax=Phocoena sinus TaxID=42100 RepID=A0A8C9EBR2_PHOSS